MKNIAYWLITIFIVCNDFVESVSFQEDVAVTMEQKLAIDKLRKRVLPYIVENYMKHDLHLLRFLRSTNFDLNQAEKKILENIRWRKENKMATIEQEDFSDFEIDYPFVRGGYDTEGRPVWFGMASEWNVRAAMVTGKGKRFLRYMRRELEMVARKLRQMQSEGKNITQGILIIDLNHFSLVTHTCAQCFVITLDVIISYENHFPGLADKIIYINAPPYIGFAFDFVRRNVSKETRKALLIYGTNQQQVLFQWIDRKYIPVELGGTLERQYI